MSSGFVSAGPKPALDSFPQFGRLPFELRLRIWELSFEERPRIVLVREQRTGGEGDVKIESCLREVERRWRAGKDIERREVLKNSPDEFREYVERGRQIFRVMFECNCENFTLNGSHGNNRPGFRVSQSNGHYDSNVIRLWLQYREEKKGVASSPNRIKAVGVDQVRTLSDVTSQAWIREIRTPSSDTSGTLIHPKWIIKSMCRLPLSANICQESALAAKPWKHSFSIGNGALHNLFFNFGLDVLYLDLLTYKEKIVVDHGIQYPEPDQFMDYKLRNFDKSTLSNIKNLALEWDGWSINPRSLSWMLQYFPRIEKIFLVVNKSVREFDLSNLRFTSLKLVDNHIFDYESEQDPPPFGGNYERREEIDDLYGELVPFNLFPGYVRHEMRVRLASIGQCWELPEISIVTLSDAATEDAIRKSLEAYRRYMDRA